MERRHGLHDNFNIVRVLSFDKMTESEERSTEVEQGRLSFAQLVKEFLDTLSHDEVVESFSAGLAESFKYAELTVSEEQVEASTRQILKPTENKFTKDAFLRLATWLQSQSSATGDSISLNVVCFFLFLLILVFLMFV